MILSQTCETKLRYGHQSTNALPAFSTGLPRKLYVKSEQLTPGFFPIIACTPGYRTPLQPLVRRNCTIPDGWRCISPHQPRESVFVLRQILFFA